MINRRETELRFLARLLSYLRQVSCHSSPTAACSECLSAAFNCCGSLRSGGVTRLLSYADFHPSPSAVCPAPLRSLAHIRSLADLDRSRARVAAWLILHHCVLLDAVCDPGSGGSRSSCKSPVAVQGLRCPAVSPLSGECPHRAAHQLNPSLAATASVACVNSHCFGHS